MELAAARPKVGAYLMKLSEQVQWNVTTQAGSRRTMEPALSSLICTRITLCADQASRSYLNLAERAIQPLAPLASLFSLVSLFCDAAQDGSMKINHTQLYRGPSWRVDVES